VAAEGSSEQNAQSRTLVSTLLILGFTAPITQHAPAEPPRACAVHQIPPRGLSMMTPRAAATTPRAAASSSSSRWLASLACLQLVLIPHCDAARSSSVGASLHFTSSTHEEGGVAGVHDRHQQQRQRRRRKLLSQPDAAAAGGWHPKPVSSTSGLVESGVMSKGRSPVAPAPRASSSGDVEIRRRRKVDLGPTMWRELCARARRSNPAEKNKGGARLTVASTKEMVDAFNAADAIIPTNVEHSTPEYLFTLPTDALHRGMTAPGGPRMARFVDKLERGEPVVVVAMGGSNTAHGACWVRSLQAFVNAFAQTIDVCARGL
jgi:hypothetical protein